MTSPTQYREFEKRELRYLYAPTTSVRDQSILSALDYMRNAAASQGSTTTLSDSDTR